MSTRVAYWTSAFEPEFEAIASQVSLLLHRFPSSVAWGLSHRHRLLLTRRPLQFCVHPRLHLLFRGVTRIGESFFHLNHIFGTIGDWFYLQGSRRRPTILTVVAESEGVELRLLNRVSRFVVEGPGGRAFLERQGIDRGRIRLIFPPVDRETFRPTPPPTGPFTALFASSPDTREWLDSRGVPQILGAAALRPEMRFRLIWRPWGDGLDVVRSWISERELTNVDLVVGTIRDIASEYANSHVTLGPFHGAGRFKSMPNSLIESLACGRPVILTPEVGLSELIGDPAAGVVCSNDPEDLASALDRVQADWVDFSGHARELADRWFDKERFLREYATLYREVA